MPKLFYRNNIYRHVNEQEMNFLLKNIHNNHVFESTLYYKVFLTEKLVNIMKNELSMNFKGRIAFR